MKKQYFAELCAALLLCLTASAFEFACPFTQGNWNSQDWVMVKSPRFPNRGVWIQEADGIRNRVPELTVTPDDIRKMKAYAGKELTAQEMEDACKLEVQKLLQGKHNPETLTSMVLKEKVSGRKVTLAATMSFEYRMAPELILANDLGIAADGLPEYNEYWEIVLFDEGFNVWHHEIRDGKPFWRKAAFIRVPFKPCQSYRVSAEVEFTSKCPILTVSCDGAVFGCMLPTLKPQFSVGIMACEGVNHFKDFAVSTK